MSRLHQAIQASGSNGTAATNRVGSGARTSRASTGVTISRAKGRKALPPLLSCVRRRRGGTAGRVRRIKQIRQKDPKVSKEELLQFEGLVTEILPDARYRVQLDNGHALVAYTAGRMKKNRIKTLAGDRVTVEISPYDLEKGRLVFRHKDERASGAPRPPVRNQFRRR
jgi:translation initiation factor IF-1